jgi:hypothetical protein
MGGHCKYQVFLDQDDYKPNMNCVCCHYRANEKTRSESSTITPCCDMYLPQVNLLTDDERPSFLYSFATYCLKMTDDQGWQYWLSRQLLPSLSWNAQIRTFDRLYKILKNNDQWTVGCSIETIFDQVSPSWCPRQPMLHFILVWNAGDFWPLFCRPAIPKLVVCTCITYRSSQVVADRQLLVRAVILV